MAEDTKHILSHLRALEAEARLLEPAADKRAALQAGVTNYAEGFLEGLKDNPTFQILPHEGQEIADFPIAEEGRKVEDLMDLFGRAVDGPGLNPASDGHLGYIPGGGIYPAALGDYLAAVTNRYAGIYFASPGAVRIENQLLRWMADLIGYGSASRGNLTSGGSIANLTAIVAARDAKSIKAAQVNRAVVYLTGQVHHAVQKALHYAGLAEVHIRHIPVDDRFRMDTEALATQIVIDREAGLLPFMVAASAGTTDTGAMDPLREIGTICQREDVWFHIDAAYGGFFVLTPECKDLFDGVELSDSFVVDPHKGLFLPYGLGAVLVRNGEQLARANAYEANYMQDVIEDEWEQSPAELGPELSKHFRGLRLWLPLQLFGVKPFRAALSEKVWLCRYFRQEVAKLPGFEVGPEPELSVAIFRYVPKTGDANDFNLRLVNAVKADGRVFLSSTNIQDVVWIRIAVLSFRTHRDTIERCLHVLSEKTQELDPEGFTR